MVVAVPALPADLRVRPRLRWGRKGEVIEESRVRRPARPAIGLRQSRHLLSIGASLRLTDLMPKRYREFGGGKCRAFLRRVSYVGCSGSRGSACVVTPRAVSSRIRGPLPRAASPRIRSRHAARPRSRAHGPRNTQRRGTGGAADPTLSTPRVVRRGWPPAPARPAALGVVSRSVRSDSGAQLVPVSRRGLDRALDDTRGPRASRASPVVR